MVNAFQLKMVKCNSQTELDANGDQISIELVIDSNEADKNYQYTEPNDMMYQGDEWFIGNIFACSSTVGLTIYERDATNSPIYTSLGTKIAICTQLGEGISNFNIYGGNYDVSWEIVFHEFQAKIFQFQYVECISEQDGDANGDQVSLVVVPDGDVGKQTTYLEPDDSIYAGDQWYIGYEYECKEGLAVQLYERDGSNDYAPLGAGVLSCDTLGSIMRILNLLVQSMLFIGRLLILTTHQKQKILQ